MLPNQINPLFTYYDQLAGQVFDFWMTQAVKLYYWPMFLAGIADNVSDLLKPQTYSICKL